MANNHSSKKNAGRPEPGNAQLPARALDRMDDDAVSKLLLKSGRAQRPWWSKLIDWLRQNSGI